MKREKDFTLALNLQHILNLQSCLQLVDQDVDCGGSVTPKSSRSTSGRRGKETAKGPLASAGSKAVSKVNKRRSVPVASRWIVTRFETCSIVPRWASGKTCVLKLKSTGKQLLSVSCFPTLRSNYDFVVALAADLDAGKDQAEVVARCADMKGAVRRSNEF